MNEYRIIGVESSPYAVKVRAVMRYRRLAYIWVARMPQFFSETAAVRPLIMPVVQFPDGEYRTDSTPIIRDLEKLHPNQRCVIPDDPVNAFLCDLIEDMADEWLTKCLFHYRFSNVDDRNSGAAWVIDDAHPHLETEELSKLVDTFTQRQVLRMPIVGCTPENAPLFETFYAELLDRLEPFVQTDTFLFGSRPSLADFGLYGQLNTMATDPTPARLINERAPRTVRWVRRLHDGSGIEGQWDRSPSSAAIALVELAGRYYLPFLAANLRAIEAGNKTLQVELNRHPYTQPVFRYQAKCYDFLRRRYASFPQSARARLDLVLSDTDCLRYLSDV